VRVVNERLLYQGCAHMHSSLGHLRGDSDRYYELCVRKSSRGLETRRNSRSNVSVTKGGFQR
jgi:hypothetical protein